MAISNFRRSEEILGNTNFERAKRVNEKSKIAFVIEKISIEFSPTIGQVEKINFYLDRENANMFYAIKPKNIKYLRLKLENLINQQLVEDKIIFGYMYAERFFYIGDKLIFKWKNEIRI